MSEYENQQRQQFEENANKFKLMSEFRENELEAFEKSMRLQSLISNSRVNPAKVAGLERELVDYEEKMEKAQHLELELMRELEQLREEYLNET